MEPGESGECRVRVNLDGKLTAVTYGHPCAVHVDPIEKKPLFHMYPGSRILSIATVGCNLHCKNCQNWQISQCNPEASTGHPLPPDQVAALARRHHCRSIAYTYTEPIVFYEYTRDCAEHAQQAGLSNVLVTAAYVNKAPWKRLCRAITAANIDIKAMSDTFYRDVCDATLKPVLDAVVLAKECGVMLEITNLVIPTLNDSDADLRALSQWIKENLGDETPLHFSRFSPLHEMTHLPPTPHKTLDRARDIALAEGLKHVYMGNVLSEDGENTHCPSCGDLLIQRTRYTIQQNRMVNGQCPSCGKNIYGIWNEKT